MNIPKIIQSMKDSGVEDHAAEILGFAISSMADKNIDPYVIAMCCTQAGTAVVNEVLPDEDLLAFGKYLKKSGAVKIHGALSKMSIKGEQENDPSSAY